MFTTDKLLEKWNPVLDVDGDLNDRYKRSVTATVLENTEKALAEERGHQQFSLTEAAPANATGSNIGNWDPILISLVRRAMPNLIAYDIAGVQPMTGPTGLIFAKKSKYSTQGGTEALFNEADTDFSGTGTQGGGSSSTVGDVNPPGTTGETSADAGADNVEDAFGVGTGMTTAAAEALGSSGGGTFNEMAFSIEKATVTAKSRALKAEYSMNWLRILRQFMAWMLNQSWQTSCQLRSSLKSTVKLLEQSTQKLSWVLARQTLRLLVLSTLTPTLMVVGA